LNKLTNEKEENWRTIDAWRSIWEALALTRGDDPALALEGHKRLCAHLKCEQAKAENHNEKNDLVPASPQPTPERKEE